MHPITRLYDIINLTVIKATQVNLFIPKTEHYFQILGFCCSKFLFKFLVKFKYLVRTYIPSLSTSVQHQGIT